MSVKQQFPSLCKPFSIYEEIPAEFLDETDVDSYFCHIFDISQSQHGLVRVSKGTNKKFFAFKLFQCCNLNTQQRYIPQTGVSISKRDLSSVVESLRDFFKTFDQMSQCLQISSPKPKK